MLLQYRTRIWQHQSGQKYACNNVCYSVHMAAMKRRTTKVQFLQNLSLPWYGCILKMWGILLHCKCKHVNILLTGSQDHWGTTSSYLLQDRVHWRRICHQRQCPPPLHPPRPPESPGAPPAASRGAAPSASPPLDSHVSATPTRKMEGQFIHEERRQTLALQGSVH